MVELQISLPKGPVLEPKVVHFLICLNPQIAQKPILPMDVGCNDNMSMQYMYCTVLDIYLSGNQYISYQPIAQTMI